MHIYSNNSVEISTNRENMDECTVNVNGENLIWISQEDEYEFKRELSELLDRYRI